MAPGGTWPTGPAITRAAPARCWPPPRTAADIEAGQLLDVRAARAGSTALAGAEATPPGARGQVQQLQRRRQFAPGGARPTGPAITRAAPERCCPSTRVAVGIEAGQLVDVRAAHAGSTALAGADSCCDFLK
ncbi:hypothetical protein IGS60_27780 [Janthinobacterium sp. FW305-128]|nr:hypothetical protein [Janthinobacterium sp. FW305-128]